MKSLKLRDLCLLFGCPCVVFLSISLLVSLKVGADFQQDSLAKWMAFILCNLLLWLLYVMFQSVLVDLFLPKKDKQSMAVTQTMEQEVQTDFAPKTENLNTLPIMTNDTSSMTIPTIETQEESVTVQPKEDSYIPSDARHMNRSKNRDGKTPSLQYWIMPDIPCRPLSMTTKSWRTYVRK